MERVSLLDLPAEIRVKIYRFSFNRNHLVLRSKRTSHDVSVRHVYEHKIIYCCKQVYLEAKPILDELMVVKLQGSIHLSFSGLRNEARRKEAARKDITFFSDASPIVRWIPASVLSTVKTVESSLRYMSHPKLLNAFTNLETLHIINDSTLTEDCEIMANVDCNSREQWVDIISGKRDETIVANLMPQLLFPTKELANRLVFMGRKKSDWLDDRDFRVLITTRGYPEGPSMPDLLPAEVPYVVREVTFDLDTLEIESGRNITYEDYE